MELQPLETDKIICVKVGKVERIGRCEFIGYEDLNSDYIGKSVIDFYGKSQNPIKYINL